MKTSITTEARRDGIAAALEAARQATAAGQGTSASIMWKGSELVVPVASVDLDLVLLNPHSHRISAQLQSLSQDVQDMVAGNPYGPEAQATITKILQETSGYERIKMALLNDGQLDPGVITTAGVLINANTRAVALRELRKSYVKVLVLPQDATTKEIIDLELLLQMRQDVKQDYSFPSQALFIEDLIESGHFTVLEVGRRIRSDLTESAADKKKASELVQLELRLLGLMREVRTASRGAVTWTYFDDKRQALLEIDQDYQKLKNTKPEEATRVRDAQLAGVIAGVEYRKLREIDASLMDNYVEGAMREVSALAPHVDALLGSGAPDFEAAPEGLDLLDDETTGAGPTLSGLYTLLAQAGPDDTVALPTNDGPPLELPRKAVAAALYGALSTAIENKQRDNRRLDDLTAPMVFLKEATRSLDKATGAYTDVRQRTAFDHAAFAKAMQEFHRAAAELLTVAPPATPGSGGPAGA
ncbi:hypothetical protein SAMN05660748_1246 [Blastococcus aggregatus]|uniref:Uncharacterized protein n=1 Tax=Blastococcus aggregatus TaxID=38502 RepID=A0A285V3B4_9ACTN|nr:hypothetical protein [Blastococcus aggregatus]SOC48550.1 hypothetical protein SAMN05660748_1246 [Blastococcus aggregatus]